MAYMLQFPRGMACNNADMTNSCANMTNSCANMTNSCSVCTMPSYNVLCRRLMQGTGVGSVGSILSRTTAPASTGTDMHGSIHSIGIVYQELTEMARQ